MASLVYVDRTPKQGNNVMAALDQMRAGISLLQQNEGKAAQAIGDSVTTFAQLFGVQDDAQAQALFDRWTAFLLAYRDPANLEMGKMRDLLSATFEVDPNTP